MLSKTNVLKYFLQMIAIVVLIAPFGVGNAALSGCIDRNGRAGTIQFVGGSDIACLAKGCTYSQWSAQANMAVCASTYRYSCFQVGTSYNKRWGITSRFPQSCSSASFPKGGLLKVGPVVQ